MLNVDVGQPLKLSENGIEIMSNPIMEVSQVGASEISHNKDFSIPLIGEMYEIIREIFLLGDDFLTKQAEERDIEFEVLLRNYNKLRKNMREGLFWTKELLIPNQYVDHPNVKSILSFISEHHGGIDLKKMKEDGLSILVDDYISSTDENGDFRLYIMGIKEIMWPDNPTTIKGAGLSEKIGIDDYVKIIPNRVYAPSPLIRSLSFHTKTGNVTISSEYSPLQFSNETGVIFKTL